MKKLFLSAFLLVNVLTSSHAVEISKEDFAKATSSLNVFNHLDAPIVGSIDEEFIYDAIKYNKIPSEVLTDYYWATKCVTNYNGIKAWDDETFFCRSKKFMLLLDLKQKIDEKEAQFAYKSIIYSERINSCGTMQDALKFYKLIRE